MKNGFGKLTRRDIAGATLFVVGSALLIAGVALGSAWLIVLGAIALAALTLLTLHALGRLRAAMGRLSRDAARDRSAALSLLQQLKRAMPTSAHHDEHAQALRRIQRDVEALTEQTTEMAKLLPSAALRGDSADAAQVGTAAPQRPDSLPGAAAAEDQLVTRLLVERLVSVGRGVLTPDEAALVSELWRAVARLKTVGRLELDISVREWERLVQPDLDAARSGDDTAVFTICRRDATGTADYGSPVLSDEWGETLTVFHRSASR